jgi:hypothetical protein
MSEKLTFFSATISNALKCAVPDPVSVNVINEKALQPPSHLSILLLDWQDCDINNHFKKKISIFDQATMVNGRKP